MSLRTFHLVFILLVTVGADLFGAWSVWDYVRTGDTLILSLGIASIVGGLGLILYAFRLVRSLDEAGIH